MFLSVFPFTCSCPVWAGRGEAVVSITVHREGEFEAEAGRESDIPCQGVLIACHPTLNMVVFIGQWVVLRKSLTSYLLSSFSEGPSPWLRCSHSSWLSISNWRWQWFDIVHWFCVCGFKCVSMWLCILVVTAWHAEFMPACFVAFQCVHIIGVSVIDCFYTIKIASYLQWCLLAWLPTILTSFIYLLFSF